MKPYDKKVRWGENIKDIKIMNHKCTKICTNVQKSARL